MSESKSSEVWQQTVDMAVVRLETQTGLALAGHSQLEITLQVREWMKAKTEGKFLSTT